MGHPKDTDDFTKKFVSLTVSHVKVEVNLTLHLPNVVDFQRESGEVVEIQVSYSWVPPACSHYSELGPIFRNFLKLSPVENTAPANRKHFEKQTKIPNRGKEKEKVYVPKRPKKKIISSVDTAGLPEVTVSSSLEANEPLTTAAPVVVSNVSVPLPLALFPPKPSP